MIFDEDSDFRRRALVKDRVRRTRRLWTQKMRDHVEREREDSTGYFKEMDDAEVEARYSQLWHSRWISCQVRWSDLKARVRGSQHRWTIAAAAIFVLGTGSYAIWFQDTAWSAALTFPTFLVAIWLLMDDGRPKMRLLSLARKKYKK